MHLNLFVKWCLCYTGTIPEMVFPLPAPQMSPTYLRADPVTVLCTLNSHPRYERPPCWSAPHTGKCCRRSQSDHPKEGVNQWLGPVYSGHQVNQRFHWLQIFGPKSLKGLIFSPTEGCPQNSTWDVKNNRWMLKILVVCSLSENLSPCYFMSARIKSPQSPLSYTNTR